MDPIRIATRGSRVALNQAATVERLLREAEPGIKTEIVIVRTSGDRDRRPFAVIGGKGLFTTEVERSVVRGDADIAVHSAKDLTSEIASGCSFRIVERGLVHDVVVGGRGGTGLERLAGLSSDATVGTSSMRRRAQLAAIRPDLQPVELRGNVDSRVARVERGDVGVAILAAAGLARAGILPAGGELDPTKWVPAPAQGAIAVEFLTDGHLVETIEVITDRTSHVEVACERAFSERLEGGCSIPLGCLARIEAGSLVAYGYLGDADGKSVTAMMSGSPEDASSLGAELAERILTSGGAEIQESIRAAMA